MNVSINNLMHHRGEPMTDCPELIAYGALRAGDEATARQIFFDFFYKHYRMGVRHLTTEGYVRRVYEAKGEIKPSHRSARSEYVKEAIHRRIDDHCDLARDIEQNGCRIPPRGRCEGSRVRLYDGHNRTWILIAMGHRFIDIPRE